MIDLTGLVFGRLTAKHTARNDRGILSWFCECACGNVSIVTTSSLRSGSTKSCGCLSIDNAKSLSVGDSAEKRKKTLKKLWASNKGRAIISKAAEKRRQMMKDGTMRKRTITPEQGRMYASKRNNEEMMETNRVNGINRIGTEMKTPLTAKCSTHHKAIYWAFKNTSSGATLKGKNLNQLIRDNLTAFKPDDVVWKGSRCRASKGLSSLTQINKKTGHPYLASWKGWFAISITEQPNHFV